MKKILCFFGIALCFVGAVAGFGFSAYYGNWFVACDVLVLSAFAFPKVKEMWYILLGYKKGGK